MRNSLWKVIVPVLSGLILLLLPVPQGLNANAWHYFALFVAVIMGLILEPLPAAALGFAGVTAAASIRLVAAKPDDAIKWALSGFSDTTVWLIFVAFMFTLGYEKTGLGKRIALVLVRFLGKKTLGLGYAVTLADLVLAPFMPSNTARSGGTIYPIVRNIPVLYGSQPGETARDIGSYIMWTAFAATCVTSSMFLTSLAPNVLAVSLVKKTLKLDITWSEWFLGFLPVGLILILTLPLLAYKIYPPVLKASEEVPEWAGRELAKMGRLSRNEVLMALLAILAVVLWIFGTKLLNAATVALLVFSLMLFTGIVTWEDVVGHKQAWNVLVWFGTLVPLADGLNKVGFVAWFAKAIANAMSGLSVTVMVLLLTAIFFTVHYMFASLTAHATALLPVFLAVSTGVPSIPVKIFSLLLCYTLGLMGILTPYATGPAPVYYGSGYIRRKEFWTLGLIFGVIYITALLAIGAPYLFTIYAR
ncbi:L-tartrate/succinate antiporter [Moorella thermoacetica]|uniref:anion permease n=1 Tax=Neomoorella thermoacetica TaxID=1525 RepID=UPI0030CE0B82